jgi:hypothetical protein
VLERKAARLYIGHRGLNSAFPVHTQVYRLHIMRLAPMPPPPMAPPRRPPPNAAIVMSLEEFRRSEAKKERRPRVVNVETAFRPAA